MVVRHLAVSFFIYRIFTAINIGEWRSDLKRITDWQEWPWIWFALPIAALAGGAYMHTIVTGWNFVFWWIGVWFGLHVVYAIGETINHHE